ncbi:TetR/AcrR family transcriptional regulator [Pseudonocardia sp. DSM 110487]|uniref:TetR/AcrR family transcriptional regulator n=1 Tax=Pseudonocardia sp. DSM 110487 TaxID=2865833 RepID=UPI001C69DE8F|nr:TetR/AcrR family transcriptional regulator [Pseudonocardia sp. DSM 110487]QYN32691.1 TetR/AcrR family transcriptional regulator [Pseudonocardia sp. DSM 110487]
MTRVLTAKGAATRRRIIEGAAAQIREHGVTATTLEDIRARTRTSKSQLFHYFPEGKDELLLAVARHEADRVLADQQPQLGELTSWRAWGAWRDTVVARYRGQGSRCPLGVVTSQLGRSTPGAQAVVTELIQRWQDELAAGVRHMQGAGEIDAGIDADRSAAALVAGVQGGVLILMSTGGTAHLEAALDTGIAFLRGRP